MARKSQPQTDPAKRGKFSELLQHVVDSSAENIVSELKLSAEVALKASEIVVSTLQEIAGGEGVYVGKGHLWAITDKHRRIYRKFNGSNHAPLAHEFHLSVRQIYSLVERIGREEYERKQLNMF
jgi:Mor family transcriptional regulator